MQKDCRRQKQGCRKPPHTLGRLFLFLLGKVLLYGLASVPIDGGFGCFLWTPGRSMTMDCGEILNTQLHLKLSLEMTLPVGKYHSGHFGGGIIVVAQVGTEHIRSEYSVGFSDVDLPY